MQTFTYIPNDTYIYEEALLFLGFRVSRVTKGQVRSNTQFRQKLLIEKYIVGQICLRNS